MRAEIAPYVLGVAVGISLVISYCELAKDPEPQPIIIETCTGRIAVPMNAVVVVANQNDECLRLISPLRPVPSVFDGIQSSDGAPSSRGVESARPQSIGDPLDAGDLPKDEAGASSVTHFVR